MHTETQEIPKAPSKPLALADLLNGAKVHSATAPDDNTLQLVLRKGRKKHQINIAFAGIAVSAVTLKRKYVSETAESPIDFRS